MCVFVDYETGKMTLTDSDLNLILNKFGANKIVVGHSTIKAMDQSVNHPTYGGTLANKVARDFPRVIQTLRTDLKKVQCAAFF